MLGFLLVKIVLEILTVDFGKLGHGDRSRVKADARGESERLFRIAEHPWKLSDFGAIFFKKIPHGAFIVGPQDEVLEVWIDKSRIGLQGRAVKTSSLKNHTVME